MAWTVSSELETGVRLSHFLWDSGFLRGGFPLPPSSTVYWSRASREGLRPRRHVARYNIAPASVNQTYRHRSTAFNIRQSFGGATQLSLAKINSEGTWDMRTGLSSLGEGGQGATLPLRGLTLSSWIYINGACEVLYTLPNPIKVLWNHRWQRKSQDPPKREQVVGWNQSPLNGFCSVIRSSSQTRPAIGVTELQVTNASCFKPTAHLMQR